MTFSIVWSIMADMKRKAKIICTIGPASQSEEVISQLAQAGMDAARLNFSHGTHDDHLRNITLIRRVSAGLRKPIAILQDLQGPKIRIGTFAHGPANLVTGGRFIISTRPRAGDEAGVSTSYSKLARDVHPGDFILIDDGLIKLHVLETDTEDVTCEVVNGGVLYDRKGINLPGVRISEPSLTAKDREDLHFGLENGVDYIALSFVRDPRDIIEIKEVIGGKRVPVIAKLEKPEALEKLDAIIALADGIMVARGDLGVEISPAKVPALQKRIIEKCHQQGVPAITATQMLDSMMVHPTPTRAEASDVANAIFDGSDAVMLSGETAFGKYPVQAVEMMARIIEEAEKTPYFRLGHRDVPADTVISFAQSICHAAYHSSREIGAKFIIAFTETGFTARLISKYRPECPIIAFTPHEETCRRVSLYWGTIPIQMDFARDTQEAIREMENKLLVEGLINKGDHLVVMAGSSMEVGGTNLLRLRQVG